MGLGETTVRGLAEKQIWQQKNEEKRRKKREENLAEKMAKKIVTKKIFITKIDSFDIFFYNKKRLKKNCQKKVATNKTLIATQIL